MVPIQCQPRSTAGVRKGLLKPAFHPGQINVQKSQGLGLLRVTFFPFCNLLLTHGLWFLVHPTALISIKLLPLLSQPFSALIPHRKEAQHAHHVVLIDKGAEGRSAFSTVHETETTAHTMRSFS